ncbi:MAG: hypothetical protein VX498_13075 [Myxococcota bacterium]|nr:hypothetical protein [Myxococcota bacterium]
MESSHPSACWLPLLATVLLLLLHGPARAGEPTWEPGAGDRSADTRKGPSFEGMDYLFPLRLHLSRGGHLEGGMGGIDGDRKEVLLVFQQEALRVSFDLVLAVTPLGLLSPDPVLRSAPPPQILVERHLKYRWVPTWRSHLGVGLSFVLPGLGQFIQEREQQFGFLFLGSALASVAAGLLALYGPSNYGPQVRRGLSGVFFGLAGTVAIGAATHAHRTGRVKKLVKVPARRSFRRLER